MLYKVQEGLKIISLSFDAFGHNTLNRHLTLLRRIDDPLCPLCGEEEDTSLHLLGNCCAIAEKRCEFFGRHFLGTGDLRQEH